MIDKLTFAEKFNSLCERFDKNFSDPTFQSFYEALSEELTTEEFVGAFKKLFKGKFFPDLQEFFDLAKADRAAKAPPPEPIPYVPPHLLLEAEKPVKAYVDMSESEKESYRAEIKRIRESLKPGSTSKSGMSSIGSLISEAVPTTPTDLASKIEHYRGWLKGGDRVFRKEAIEWAMDCEDVELITDALGNPIDFQEVAF